MPFYGKGDKGGGRGGGGGARRFGGGSGNFRSGRGGNMGGGGGNFKRNDMGPPDHVIPLGFFTHTSQDDLVIKSELEEVPFFNAPIYLQNKEQIGKIDEIFGTIRNYYVSVRLSDEVKATSFDVNDKLYIDPAKLLPLSRFLPKPPGEKGVKGPKKGSAGGRGGKGGKSGFGGGRGGKGGFNNRMSFGNQGRGFQGKGGGRNGGGRSSFGGRRSGNWR